jgi:hypothetical protein
MAKQYMFDFSHFFCKYNLSVVAENQLTRMAAAHYQLERRSAEVAITLKEQLVHLKIAN